MATARTAKKLLASHGEVRPQPSSDWTGSFPIPPAVKRFYQEVGPVDVNIEAHGNGYFLPSLANLWNFQAGYRWNGLDGVLIEDWNDDWLVVAGEGGDPFIFQRTAGTVLHAFCGERAWDASEMFPDLNTMAACLAQIGKLISEAGDSYQEKDCSIRSEFTELVSARLQELLGKKSDAETTLRMLNWG
jgi:hypothetical protein